MPVPIIAAGISAAATVAGGVIAANATKSATKTATQAATYATDQNNALARDIYGQNKEMLGGYASRGDAAGNAINALLRIGKPQLSGGGPAIAQFPQPANTNAPAPANTNAGAYYGGGTIAYGGNEMGGVPGGGTAWTLGGQEAGAQLPTGQVQQVTGATPDPSADPYEAAFANYRDSTGYNFRLGEGYKALNSGYAANGLLRSGAAAKAALKLGQDYGSGEFSNYLAQLAQQQGVGLSGASALAGVGTNYVANATANNNALASVQANAALARGQANSSIYGSAANALGQLGGAFVSSYKPPAAAAPKSTNILWGKVG
jgi:hypothetical protein